MYVPRQALQQLHQAAYKDDSHDDLDLSVCTSPDRPFRIRCNDDAADALQVASSIIEGATQGQIVNGDYSGTPNRIIMTYIDTSPSVSITPEALAPVVLFAGMTHYDMYRVCISVVINMI